MQNIQNAMQLIDSLYLGDRYVKSIFLDSVYQEVRITIDLISKVDPKTGTWDYYDKEDIEDGAIVFKAVLVFQTEQIGALANDAIFSISAHASEAYPNSIEFDLELGIVDSTAASRGASLKIVASSISIEAPKI